MEREAIPLLAKLSQTPSQTMAERDESAEDDVVFNAMLVDPNANSQVETKITRVERETTDDN